MKPIKKYKVDKSALSSKSGTERPAKKSNIKIKEGCGEGSKSKLENELEPKQGTKKQTGPIHYYTKRRQRMTTRNSEPPMPSHTVQQVDQSHHEKPALDTTFMPPYIPAALIAVRRSDRGDA